MSYGRHATHSHGLKSLSPNSYSQVHSTVYGSNQSYLQKSAFKKPLVPSIPKYSSSKVSSTLTKKASPTSREPKIRTALVPIHVEHDDGDHYQTTSASYYTPPRSVRRSDGHTSSYGRSSSLSSLSKESTFARLGLHSMPNEAESRYSSSYGSYKPSSNLDHNSYSLSRKTSSDKPSSKSRYDETIGGSTGIVNIGNTCFMNCILQCLSNTKPLRDFCLSSRYRDDLNPNSKMRGNLLNGFVDVIRQLWSNEQMVVSPKNFRTQIQKFSPRFLGNDQQDSQEFLRFLLEGLHEEINQVRRKSREPIPDMDELRAREKAQKTWDWYKGKDDSFIFDMFVGQLESALKCKECNHTSLTYDPFWDLSVPVNKAGETYMSGDTTMNDCLHAFTKEETLDHDEKPFCDRCKMRRRMTKKLSIYKFPPVLVLHLKRFSEGSRFRQKLSHLVKFPLQGLDLTPFASRHYEDETPPVYDLYAVSNHIGSCYGGHYTAYCLNPVTKQWNSYNDSSVRTMSDSGACTKEAYVLFYQLRNRKNSRL